MTTISSEDSTTSTAPQIFHISTSSDSPNVHKCPLCKKFRRFFYCRDCILSGVFTSRNNESFNSIRKTLGEVDENRRYVEKNCLRAMENKQKNDIMKIKIRQGKERNGILFLAIEEKRQKRHMLNQKLADQRKRNQERSDKLKAYKTKNDSFEDTVSIIHENVQVTEQKLDEINRVVKRLTTRRVEQLFKYVFPITEVKPTIEMESSGDSVMKELAEASQTTYVRDKWVYTDYSNEMQYSVVAPCLPASGNYCNYSLWAQNRDVIPIPEDTDIKDVNPALTIAAALTYTAQLVNVLSYLLNVRLPYKMAYSEFSSTLSEQQFARRVARLNANILHLCVSQKVDLNDLKPTATIHNLLELKENESRELGTQGPVEINDLQARALEKIVSADLKTSDDSDSDDGDLFTVGWEAVPHVQCPEAPAGAVQSSLIHPQQASSMAGGLMNSAVASVASIWKGFTGR